MADISVSPGSSQSITVTFQNTSDVTTHYRLEDAGRFSGWTITKKCREGPGSKDCEIQNVDPGDTVALNYQVSAPSPAPVVIYDDQVIIEENTTVAFQLDAGTYRLELTATGDGVEVLWPGSDCSGQPRETQSHTEICTLKRSGQFSVSNPSTLGTGPPSSFTVKVTNLPGGSATADWVLKAAHTCGLFGCRYQDVDSQSQLFSVR